MKKNLLFIGLAFILLFLSGCIISFTPKSLNQTMHVGQDLTFNIDVFQSQYDIEWVVDMEDQPVSYGKTSFTYTPGLGDVGTHYITVVETSEQTGTMFVPWKVTVLP
jgi:hypothetical protein